MNNEGMEEGVVWPSYARVSNQVDEELHLVEWNITEDFEDFKSPNGNDSVKSRWLIGLDI